MAFSGLDGTVDASEGLVARTAHQEAGLEIKLPGECSLSFPPPSGKVFITGDCLAFESGSGKVTTVFLDTHHLLLRGPCQIRQKDGKIASLAHGDMTLIGVRGKFLPEKILVDLDHAFRERRRWLESQPGLPEELDLRNRTYAKALSLMKTQVSTPQGSLKHRWTTPDRWPHRWMWLWDSAFHAIGWRHLDLDLAREMLLAVLDVQEKSGFIPHFSSPDKSSAITQPPVLAFGARLVNERQPRQDWIERIYPYLAAYVDWDAAHRDQNGDGLCEWMIEADRNSRSGESGMDNSPRFDAATRLEAVDFNSFLALEYQCLAGFAVSLGREDEALKWRERSDRICRLINEKLWDAKRGFYLDYDSQKRAHSPVMAVSGFMPLICGAASPQQAQQLAEHLKNKDTFGTQLLVPSVAVNSGSYYAKDMWRGPVWINTNWLIAYGFERYGMHEVSAEIRHQSLAEIERMFDRYGTIFEFYDDRQEVDPPQLMRKGKCAPEVSPYHQVFHDYGWTATLYVDWVRREVSE